MKDECIKSEQLLGKQLFSAVFKTTEYIKKVVFPPKWCCWYCSNEKQILIHLFINGV